MNEDFRRMMEQYEQELLRLRQQAIPVVVPEMPPEADNFQGNISQEENAGDYAPPTEDTAFTASFQVRVTAANEAIPIPNALVIISRETDGEPVVQQILLTDSSGLTEPVLLPATDPALTMQPADNIPLATYEIQVSAPDYYRVRNSGVPLYGGIKTVLPVSMIPLPEFEDPDATELEFTVPRNNL